MIDTVELFHFKRQRKLSLRFLAAQLLGIQIQRGTHDAIEDAITALRLYQASPSPPPSLTLSPYSPSFPGFVYVSFPPSCSLSPSIPYTFLSPFLPSFLLSSRPPLFWLR